jgi:hypothetical protein
VALLVWAYFAAVATDPGSVPAGWHPFEDEQVTDVINSYGPQLAVSNNISMPKSHRITPPPPAAAAAVW